MREGTPTPLFCVSAGIIGLTGECRRCTGIIGLRRSLRLKKRRKNKKKGQKRSRSWTGRVLLWKACAGGLVASIHKTLYRTIYQVSIDIVEVLEPRPGGE